MSNVEIKENIAEIAEYVDVLVESDNVHLDNLSKTLTELEQEDENFMVQENDQMDKILSRKFDISKKIEQLEDEREKLTHTLLSATNNKTEADKNCELALKTLGEQQSRLEIVKTEIEKVKAESKEIHSLAENVPKLSQNKKLYYSISGITLDKTVSEDEVKGFVVNHRKDDVNNFDFKLSDDGNAMGGKDGVSQHFVSNYLWDLIAAAADPKWEEV